MDIHEKDTVIISLNLDEGRIVFEALAEMPFKNVYELIGQLNNQTNEHAANGLEEGVPLAFTLTHGQVNLMLRALSEMPFKRVCSLLENLNQQLQE
jgi:hypothetical protein